MNLGLTWHDVIHMYECHSLTSAGFYLKSWLDTVRMVPCLPKSNKGLKDDYLIVFMDWHDDFIAQLGMESQVGYLKIKSLSKGFSPFSFTSFQF